MKAKLLVKDKYVYKNGAIREMVIWQLPNVDNDYPHGLKYRLFYGHPECCLLRFDNERAKGDHYHEGDKQLPYHFVSVEKLIHDFKTGIARIHASSKALAIDKANIKSKQSNNHNQALARPNKRKNKKTGRER